MEFRVLGPLEVVDGASPVPLAGPKQRMLLGLLLAEPGRRVARDAIAEALWPDRAAGDATHALELQVARLRRTIGALRVVTADGGYRIELAGDALDADRFAALVREARDLPTTEAAARLREALALWRGRAFGELGDEPELRAAASALDERRVAAAEDLFEAELELGRHAAVVEEIERVASGEPFRERVQAQLMLALYRCGRQADALSVYDALRRRLAGELGIDPGEQLRDLHMAIVRQDPALQALRGRRRTVVRRARVLPALAGTLVALLAGGAALLLRGADDHAGLRAAGVGQTAVPERHLAFIDFVRGRVLASLPLGEDGGDFAQGRDFDWLLTQSGALLQIDPRGRRVVRSSSLGVEPGGQGLAVGLGAVWVVANDRPLLLRIDPVYGAVQRRFRLPNAGVSHTNGTPAVAVAAGSVWVAQGERRVLRIDPHSGRVLARVSAPGAVGLDGGADALWVAGGDHGAVYRIDTVANTVVERVPLDPYVCCIAIGGGFVWAMNYRVWKLSSDGGVLSSIPIEGEGANLLWTGDALWVSEGASGRETRIDAADESTRVLRTGGLALLTGARGDVATVVVGEAPPDLLAGVRGPVARIELTSDHLQPDDPALRARPRGVPGWRDQLLDVTCGRLLTLRRASSPRGWDLIPELAGLPGTADGRAWTFRIAPGRRFSPPSNAPITAAAMRYTIERALSPQMGSRSAALPLLRDVAGLARFRAGRAQHISGLTARGDRLTVRLRRPAPDLPLRLASSAFCAVPEGTPPSATRFAQEPLPSAGPYYLATHYGGIAALLLRNPGYRGPRQRRVAAFLYDLAIQEPAAVDRVARGRADVVAGFGDTLGRRSTVARGSSANAAHWTRRTLPASRALRLRTDAGPLADAGLRRAVTLALDRRALATPFEDDPATRALPPGAPGAVQVAIPPADPSRARALVGGRHVTLVFAPCREGAPCRALGALVRSQLGRAGIRVRVRPGARDADLTAVLATLTEPDPLGFLAALSGGRAPSPRPGPATLASRAQRLDAELASSGRLFAFGTPTIGVLASSRLGCRAQLPLGFGDDLAALCPRSVSPRAPAGSG